MYSTVQTFSGVMILASVEARFIYNRKRLEFDLEHFISEPNPQEWDPPILFISASLCDLTFSFSRSRLELSRDLQHRQYSFITPPDNFIGWLESIPSLFSGPHFPGIILKLVVSLAQFLTSLVSPQNGTFVAGNLGKYNSLV